MTNPVSLRRRGVLPSESVPVVLRDYELVSRLFWPQRFCAEDLGSCAEDPRARPDTLRWGWRQQQQQQQQQQQRRRRQQQKHAAATPRVHSVPCRPQTAQCFELNGMANIRPLEGAEMHGIVHRVTHKVRAADSAGARPSRAHRCARAWLWFCC